MLLTHNPYLCPYSFNMRHLLIGHSRCELIQPYFHCKFLKKWRCGWIINYNLHISLSISLRNVSNCIYHSNAWCVHVCFSIFISLKVSVLCLFVHSAYKYTLFCWGIWLCEIKEKLIWQFFSNFNFAKNSFNICNFTKNKKKNSFRY